MHQDELARLQVAARKSQPETELLHRVVVPSLGLDAVKDIDDARVLALIGVSVTERQILAVRTDTGIWSRRSIRDATITTLSSESMRDAIEELVPAAEQLFPVQSSTAQVHTPEGILTVPSLRSPHTEIRWGTTHHRRASHLGSDG